MFRLELLMSAADLRLTAGNVTADTVDGVRREMQQVQSDPNAVSFHSIAQARTHVY